MPDLEKQLQTLQGAPFGKLQWLANRLFHGEFYSLPSERAQGSPGAHRASIACVSVEREQAGFATDWNQPPIRRLALKGLARSRDPFVARP